ncbi:hypothetical protein Tco_0104358 [Tanacetum coccineum]
MVLEFLRSEGRSARFDVRIISLGSWRKRTTNVEDDVFGGSVDISPPRSTEAPPAGTTSGGAEDPDKLTALCSLVNSLVQKIDSQASDLKAHKLVFKEVVGKLVKKDVDPLIKLAKAAATAAADESVVPPGGSNENDIPPISSIPAVACNISYF